MKKVLSFSFEPEDFRSFPETSSTLLHQAMAEKEEDAKKALQDLGLIYLPAIISYVSSKVKNKADADEISQVVLMRLLRSDYLRSKADRIRVSFRALICWRANWMIKEYFKRSKSDLLSVGEEEIWEGYQGQTIQDPRFDEAWATNIMKQALKQLASDHPNAHSVICLRGKGDSYERIKELKGFSVVTTDNLIRRGYVLLRRFIIKLVSDCQGESLTPESLRGEVEYLMSQVGDVFPCET